MAAVTTEGLPDWHDAHGGGLVRGALWLMQEVGPGNTFTKSQLRAAFPDIAQIDRRIRDLRDYEWVIATSREDPSLDQAEQRFVEPGIKVWDPEERKKRNRAAVSTATRRPLFQRGTFACELCGRPVVSLRHGPGVELVHRVALADGGSDEPENLMVLCSACHAARDGADGVSELAARASSLPIRERTRLLTWITMGERPRTATEDIWAQYQKLADGDRQQLARHLARLLNEDTQAEDAMP
ncbi:HNH endonuclease signature motif containing protein [Streptomyces sp. 135]|uniref:HNH endonuclease n=1 Tax=Streptomyces sp. 135 TaxID=2838850 RepID=UPI001CBCF61B|nr:HNH endonuclease signature motif containing protein [Streptomyces sp. 135]